MEPYDRSIANLSKSKQTVIGAENMHMDKLELDVSIIRRLLAAQFPQWADLPIEYLRSSGTDHAIFRLNDDMAIRLPLLRRVVDQVHKEQRWLPVLAPHLPLQIPVPIGKGAPGEGYPWHWSVYRWLEGEDATVRPIADEQAAAIALARFVNALRKVDPTGGPSPGEHNFGRGVPLTLRDARTREAIHKLDDVLDAGELTAAWEDALRAPAWDRRPVWIHGDLSPLNLLVERGELNGVIDFGAMAIGDPACDLLCAWTVLSGDGRQVFRDALGVDDATWARGRGWALSVGLIVIPHYQDTNPVLTDIAHRAIVEALADREP